MTVLLALWSQLSYKGVMESSQFEQIPDDTAERRALAIKMTAPGTALRVAHWT